MRKVRVCVLFYFFTALYMSKNAKNIRLEKGFRGDPTSLQKFLALLFSCYVSFIFVLINIQKITKKHANNQKSQNIIFIINLDPKSSDRSFYFFLNQISNQF